MLKCKTKGQALHRNGTGQALMEFSFCMIVVLLMIYGTIMVFRWTGLDLAERRAAHDRSLSADDAVENYGPCVRWDSGGSCSSPEDITGWCYLHGVNCCPCVEYRDMEKGPMKQLDTYFYKPIGMNAVWEGD